jgi:hypothetical protein
VVGPVVAQLVCERWPHGGGYEVLAEAVGCHRDTIEGIVAQHNEGLDFDLADKILSKLGRPDLVPCPETFWETCASPFCSRRFPEYQHGPRKLYCSRRCGAMAFNLRHDRGSGMTVSNRCRRGHELTPENSVLQCGRRTCRICKLATQRAWKRRRRAIA